MNPEPENPGPVEVLPPSGPGERLIVDRPTVAVFATGSFLAVLMLYLAGQEFVLLNLPVGLMMTSLFIFGAAGLALPAASNLKPREFTGLRAVDVRLIALGVVVGVINLPLANFLMAVAAKLLPKSWSEVAEDTTQMLSDATSGTRVLLVIAASVAAPLGEELFFRGWMQGLLVQRFRPLSSALVVAVIFSATHADPVGFGARVELGLLFGLARLWSGSLWPGITIHATHNLVSTLLFYLAGDGDEDSATPAEWRDAALLACVAFVAVIVLMRSVRRVAVSRAAPLGDAVPFRFTPRAALHIVQVDVALIMAVVLGLRLLGSYVPGAPPAATPATAVHRAK